MYFNCKNGKSMLSYKYRLRKTKLADCLCYAQDEIKDLIIFLILQHWSGASIGLRFGWIYILTDRI